MSADDVDIRRRAVRAIAELPGSPAVTALLVDGLGDTDAAVRGRAALALGGRGVDAAVPILVEMVVEGVNDVEAAEILATLSQGPGRADGIMKALVDELAAPAASSAVRIRLAQALVEISGPLAQDVLRRLAHDDDRTVALIASTLVELPAPG